MVILLIGHWRGRHVRDIRRRGARCAHCYLPDRAGATDRRRPTLLQSFGGWAVSSVRLGVLLLVGPDSARSPRPAATLGLRRVRLSGADRLDVRHTAVLARSVRRCALYGQACRGARSVARVRLGRPQVRRTLHVALTAVHLGGALLADYALLATGPNFHHYPDAPSRFAGLAGTLPVAHCRLAVLALAALFLWFRDRHRVALVLYVLAWVPMLMSITRIAIFGFAIASLVLAVAHAPPAAGRRHRAHCWRRAVSYAPLRERMAFGSDAQSWQTIAATFAEPRVQGLNTQGRTELWSVSSRSSITFTRLRVVARVLPRPCCCSSASFGGVSQAHSDYMAAPRQRWTDCSCLSVGCVRGPRSPLWPHGGSRSAGCSCGRSCTSLLR